ncbi:MAG: V4R domain protein [Candidatus Argoarchaeum ethanivorans]|uniref:V4R domain protein n=1 Tax=Candidatus Argoarchaeum ethanivorans TaxID=2608793 RepID=A0A811T8E6_9EURY|nr:MAG: V4R domain protein [Candidatus Argoarchaeum ethanivorans]
MSRDVCTFYVGDNNATLAWFKVTLIDKQGSLSKIPVVFADNGVNQLFGYFGLIEQGVKGKYITFVEFTEKTSVNKLVNELKNLDEVLDVKYHVTKKIIIQTAEFPLEMFNSRAIISRNTTFSDIIEEIEDAAPNANALIFQCGLKGGMDAARYFKEVAGIKKRDFITLLKGILFSAGWGVIDIDFNFDSCKGTISVKDSFLAEIKRSTEHAQCGYLSGYFAGFFTEVLDQAIHVQETKCKSMGAEECEFTILPVAKKFGTFMEQNREDTVDTEL